jgi:predicted DNA-binding ribbon-helix-helix protein
LSNLVTSIDVERKQGNLSSCLRLFVLEFYQSKLNERRARKAPPGEPAIRPVKSA